jgi:hypothetical protein
MIFGVWRSSSCTGVGSAKATLVFVVVGFGFGGAVGVEHEVVVGMVRGLAIDSAVLDVGELFGCRNLSIEKYLVDFEENFGGSVEVETSRHWNLYKIRRVKCSTSPLGRVSLPSRNVKKEVPTVS